MNIEIEKNEYIVLHIYNEIVYNVICKHGYNETSKHDYMFTK